MAVSLGVDPAMATSLAASMQHGVASNAVAPPPPGGAPPTTGPSNQGEDTKRGDNDERATKKARAPKPPESVSAMWEHSLRMFLVSGTLRVLCYVMCWGPHPRGLSWSMRSKRSKAVARLDKNSMTL